MATIHKPEHFIDGNEDAGLFDVRQQKDRLYDHLNKLNLSYVDKKAIHKWGGTASHGISMHFIGNYLKSKNPDVPHQLDYYREPDYDKVAGNLITALGKQTGMPEDVHAYHGSGVKLSMKIGKMEPGQRIFCPAPFASSLHHKTAINFCKPEFIADPNGQDIHQKTVLHLHLPRGYRHAMFVGNLTGHPYEDEVTVAPGQHFLLTGKQHFSGFGQYTRFPHRITVASLVPVLTPTNAATHVAADPNQIDSR